jgi:hypothetical protein
MFTPKHALHRIIAGAFLAGRSGVTPRSRCWACTALIVFFVLWNAHSRAEESPRPFETATISFSLTSNTNNSSFHDLWSPKTGGAVEVEMPFYVGDVQLGLHVFKNSAKRADVPGFRSAFLYLGWEVGWHLTGGLKWSGGVRAGDF